MAAHWIEHEERPLLSGATVDAIADLGSDGVVYEPDVQPALAAAGITEVLYRPHMEPGFVYIPGASDHIKASLRALDLKVPENVDKVLRFAARLAEVYAASNRADRLKIVRLRNSLADDGFDLTMDDANMSGFSIDRRGIARMMQEIQREFDKHPIQVPVSTDSPAAPGNTIIYNGPVIHGDVSGAQLAWGNQTVNQTQQDRTEVVAPGFELIAQAIAKTLEGLPAVGLDEDDLQEAEAVANEALAEVTQAEPRRGLVRRAVAALKGFLGPIAGGLQTGAAAGAQDWATTAIAQLGVPF